MIPMQTGVTCYLQEGRAKRPMRIYRLVIGLWLLVGMLVCATSASASTPAAPSIKSESVSGLTNTDATLEADIDTGGLATHYQFRLAYGCGFGLEACPAFCIAGQPCPGPWNSVITVPLPSADLDPSNDVQHVSLDLNSVGVTLQPYKYRYSVEATNTEGTAQGPAKYFEPPPASNPPPSPSAPSIQNEYVSRIKATEATLEAKIDPSGLETEYEFWLEYAVCQDEAPDTAGCEAIVLERAGVGAISASYGAHTVSKRVTGLNPGYTYTFWAVATNTEGEGRGSNQQFKTLSMTPGVPVVQSTWVSDITTDDATLHATINPNGLNTTYKFFLYEPCPEPGPGEVSCQAISVLPLPGGTIPGSFEPVDVSASASDGGYALKPGIEYEWAIRASNEEGLTFPDGQPFFIESPPATGEEGPTVEEGDAPEATADTSDTDGSSNAPTPIQTSPKVDPPREVLKKHCKRKPRHASQRHRKQAKSVFRCVR